MNKVITGVITGTVLLLVAWAGLVVAGSSPQQLGDYSIIYSLDSETQTWQRYVPDRPDLSNLVTLEHGVGYIALNDQGWNLVGYCEPMPEPTPAPSPDQVPLTLLDDLTVADVTFIAKVLEGAIPEYGNGVTRRTVDREYYLPSQRDAQRIIEWSQVNTILPKTDQYDCDDYAEALRHDFRLHGVNSCGLVVDWSGGHSYNVLIFADGQYWFIEPQQDSIVEIGEGTYKLERGWIRL